MATVSLAPGTRCGPLAFSGDYIVIGEKLGSGIQAGVFACSRESTGEALAVKVFDLRQLELTSDAEAIQKQLKSLETEVQVALGIKDKHCLGLYDIWRTPSTMMLVMERLYGGDLFNSILEKKCFNEVEARYVFRQVLDGLQALHAKDIMHRDLKPENVMVSSQKPAVAPDSGTLLDVKICDFGLAKMVNNGSVAKSTLGTPQYWAPEVLNSGGAAPYGFGADCWSLGVLLYVMLRGGYPFKTNADIMAGNLDFSHKRFQAVSEEAKDLIRKLLTFDPANRAGLDTCRNHPWLTGRQPEEEPNGKSDEMQIETTIGETTEDQVMIPVHNGPDSTAIVPSRDPVGNSPLSLQQLLEKTVAVVRSLAQAELATRATQPLISLRIRSILHQANALSETVTQVMTRYGQVSADVLGRILPDLKIAVEEVVPEMACDLFDLVNTWVKEMQDSGQEVVSKSEEVAALLEELILDAQKQRMLPQIEGGYREDQQCIQDISTVSIETLPSATSRPSTAESGDSAPKVLAPLCTLESSAKEQLCTFADKAAMCDNPETALCDPKCVDLLFFGVPRVTPGDTSTSGAIVPFAQNLPIELPRLSAAQALLAAVSELREVRRILKDCMKFWISVGDTVHELSRMKDHTKVLVTYASKNARLRQRFDLRLSEFTQFWQALQVLCVEYCKVVVPRLEAVAAQVCEAEKRMDQTLIAPAVSTTSAPIAPTCVD